MDDLSIVHGRPAARAFRLLGVLGAETLPGWVIGPLIGAQDTEDVLDALVDANLLRLVGTDAAGQPRYRLHDLLRPTPHVPPPTTTRAPNAVPPWNGCWEAGSRWPSRRGLFDPALFQHTPGRSPRRQPDADVFRRNGDRRNEAECLRKLGEPELRHGAVAPANHHPDRARHLWQTLEPPPRQTDLHPTADQTSAEGGPWHRRTSPSVNRNEGSTGKIVPPAGHATPRNALDGPRRPDGWQVIEDRHPGRIRSIEHSTSARTLGVCEC